MNTASVPANHHSQYLLFLVSSRLLGVDRVVIYNSSCGAELDRVLQDYSKEGFVEMVPWPINEHMVPSRGWLHSESGGDVHYFGQQTTLNECIYRSMERSRYVLLNDIDEIIMPYQHADLMSLMNMLQEQHPNVGNFLLILGLGNESGKQFNSDFCQLNCSLSGVPLEVVQFDDVVDAVDKV